MNLPPFPSFDLPQKLLNIGSAPQKRTVLIGYFLQNPKYLPALLNLCFSENTKISAKACRLLEFICNKKLSVIWNELDIFIPKIGQLEKDAEIRPVGKICQLLLIAYYSEKNLAARSRLSKNHRQKIVETCFNWMLTDRKVAAQAHAMTCLQLLGTEFSWIHPELKIILERNYASKSAGYQARARMVLKKMKP